MYRGHFIFRILATLLLVAILAGAGFMIFRAGQAQGYALGAATSGKALPNPPAGAPAAPYYGYYPGYGGWGPHFFFPFFPFLGFFFVLFLIFAIGGLFRRAVWGWGRPPMGPHGHGWYGAPPPWGNPGQPGQPGTPESGQTPPPQEPGQPEQK